jgi:hypothetical protein
VTSAAPPPPKQPKEADVAIYVSGCRDLMNRDGFGSGKSDPFLIFFDHTGKEILRTKRVDDELNPTWSQDQATAKLKIAWADVQAKPGATLDVQVWDWNLTSNSFLGQTRLPVHGLFAADPAVVGRHTFELEPRADKEDKKVLEAGKGKLGTITIDVSARVAME